jgi:hypothetical protein
MHAMQTVTMLLVALTLASGVNPTTGLATDWTRAGQTRVPPLYPYQDLPGVKAQPDKTEEEQFSCRTETRLLRRRHDEIFRSGGMPTLVYVCDRNGIGSTGTLVPRRGHYQPVR